MAYTLPLDNRTWPDFRILVAPSFAAPGGADSSYIAGGTNSGLPLAATSKCAWQVLPYKRRGINQPGYWVQSFERVCLPYISTAVINFDYGDMDDAATPSPATAALDTNWEVRIQASPMGANQWTTVYWGCVAYTEDKGDPGAVLPRGRKIFHCVDGLYYKAKNWTLNRHGSLTHGGSYGTAQRGDVVGPHPGYNFSLGHDSPLLGNRYTSSTSYTTPAGTSVWFHEAPGSTNKADVDGNGTNIFAASLWTDQQAVEHALGSTRSIGEPCFSLQGATYLLGSTNPWPVSDHEDVHSFLTRVLRRERGRGVAYLDWTETDPSGDLTVFISVQPQLAADVVYTDPSTGGGVALSGAISRGNTVAVDLVGDHRCVAESFQLGDPSQFRVDYLVTEGEPIEVLASLSVIDGKNPSSSTSNAWDGVGLIRGWTDSQQSTFIGLPANSAQAKEEARYDPVFQLFRFNSGWDGRLADGDGGASVDFHRADYRCDAYGNIITPYDAVGSTDPRIANDLEATGWLSPLLVEVLADTPLIEGYDYSQSVPQRYDQATIKNEVDRQPRRRMIGYVRVAANRYVQFDDPLTPLSASINIDGRDIWVRHAGDQDAGTRFFAAPTSSGFSSSGTYDYSAIVITAGLRLPSRVRLASGNPNGRRRGRIYHPGSHLWLASPGAIWSLDTSTTSSGGYAGRRGACGATITKPSGGGTSSKPGILRDDRSGLAMIHNLAWQWYGTDTTHRTAQWALRDCGFLPSYSAYAGTSIPSNGGSLTTVAYPRIGQVVTTLNANGTTTTLNTPVTRVRYENESGITTWSTEWSELEHVQR